LSRDVGSGQIVGSTDVQLAMCALKPQFSAVITPSCTCMVSAVEPERLYCTLTMFAAVRSTVVCAAADAGIICFAASTASLKKREAGHEQRARRAERAAGHEELRVPGEVRLVRGERDRGGGLDARAVRVRAGAPEDGKGAVAGRRRGGDAAEELDRELLADEAEVVRAEHREVGDRIERLVGARERDRGDVGGGEGRARVLVERAVHVLEEAHRGHELLEALAEGGDAPLAVQVARREVFPVAMSNDSPGLSSPRTTAWRCASWCTEDPRRKSMVFSLFWSACDATAASDG
jgi:hypothetical protein